MKYMYPAFTLFIALTIYSAVGMSQTMKESELVNFTAQPVHDKVWLAWSAKQEENVNYYGIERSYDNKEFDLVALMFPAEDPAAVNNYPYKDPIINTPSVIYYRLKMVDKDGTYKYSGIRMVRMGSSNEPAKVAAYPSPVVNELHISVPARWQNKTVSCQLLNTRGSIIKSFNILQTATIGMSDVPPGAYYIKVANGKETSTQTILKSGN